MIMACDCSNFQEELYHGLISVWWGSPDEGSLNSIHKSLLSFVFSMDYFVFNYFILSSGMAHMVYPGAVHSRFEHSLGVYWLAGEAVHKLKAQKVRSLH